VCGHAVVKLPPNERLDTANNSRQARVVVLDELLSQSVCERSCNDKKSYIKSSSPLGVSLVLVSSEQSNEKFIQLWMQLSPSRARG